MPHTDDSPRPNEPAGPSRPTARGERPPHRPRHRLAVLAIVVLLIALPAGYLVQSAFQSRSSGKDKERAAAATGLGYGRPSRAHQRIYNIPVPYWATRVAFYEANSWKKSTMWVQFRTSHKKLSRFLTEVGSRRSELVNREVAVTDKQAREVGWRFDEPRSHYWSTRIKQPKSKPDLWITVDTTYKNRPRVYVVSKIEF